MDVYLIIIGALCLTTVPVMLVFTVLNISRKKPVGILIQGMIILLILAISAFILAGMLNNV